MNPLLKAARNLPGHWHKGDYTDGNGNYCAAGHVYKAMGLTDEGMMYDPDHLIGVRENAFLSESMNKTAQEYSNGKYHWIAEFNDANETTEDDVVTVLEKAGIRYDEMVK